VVLCIYAREAMWGGRSEVMRDVTDGKVHGKFFVERSGVYE